jgi:hypothetical protein
MVEWALVEEREGLDSRVGPAAGNLPEEDIGLVLVGDIGQVEDIGPAEGIGLVEDIDPAEDTDSEDMLPESEADTAAVVDGLLEDIVAVVGPAIVVAAEVHHMAVVGTDQGEDIAGGEHLGADIRRAVVVDNRGPAAAVDGRLAEHTQRCYRGVAGVRRRYSGGATWQKWDREKGSDNRDLSKGARVSLISPQYGPF